MCAFVTHVDPREYCNTRGLSDAYRAQRARLRQLELVRPLGAARLVAVPYVTEGARVTLLLPVRAARAADAAGFLRRYAAACAARAANTALVLVLLAAPGAARDAQVTRRARCPSAAVPTIYEKKAVFVVLPKNI